MKGISQGDFDMQSFAGLLGINYTGDFDQHSIAGVDFGEDYTKSRKDTKLTTMEGVQYMYGQQGQLGCSDAAYEMGTFPEQMSGSADFGDHYSLGDCSQMGEIPTGLRGPYQLGMKPYQLGEIPRGMGEIPRGMGLKPYQLGEIPRGMGSLETVKAALTKVYFGVPAYLLVAAALGGFVYYQKSQGKKVFGF